MWISSEYTPEQQQQIKSILDLLVKFKIIQPISLLLATIIKYNKTDFIRLLRYIEVLSMRYNIICNLPPNDQESLYKNLAYQVTNNNLSILAIKEEFKKFYPSDKEFETAFIYKDFKQNQRAKYLLLKLQNYLDTSIGCFHESDLTIEHILPKEPTCEWLDKFKNPEAFIYKLGNMVLIPKKTNKDIDRKLFTDKKDLILKTSLAINNTIAEDEVWNESSIGKRQKYLAKQAKTIWRIDF
jgi:hypothetical protein